MIISGNNILKEVKNILSKAQHSILISSAWIGKDVLQKVFEGVNLSEIPEKKIIIRTSERKDLEIDKPDSLNLLYELGFEIAFNRNLHAKFIIVDNHTAILGSANLTTSGLEGINNEANILIENNPQQVDLLIKTFNKFWEESQKYQEDIVGITLNPGTVGCIELLILNPQKLSQGSFVIVKDQENNEEFLCCIDSISIYDTSFFKNPFGTSQEKAFPSFNDFYFVFQESKPQWIYASLISLLNSLNGVQTHIATAKMLGKIDKKQDYIELVNTMKPLKPKLFVFTPPKEILENISTPRKGRKINIGTYYNLNTNYHLDFDEISSTHLAVLGTTGSGKSHFVKRLVTQIALNIKDSKIYIIDPHGEYRKALEEFLDSKSDILTTVKIPQDIDIINDKDDITNLLSEYKVLSGSGEENVFNEAVILKFFKDKEPQKLIEELERSRVCILKKHKNEKFLISYYSSIFQTTCAKIDDNYIPPHPQFIVKELPFNLIKMLFEELKIKIKKDIENLNELINTEDGEIIIFDLSPVDDPQKRTQAAAYIAQKIFKAAKEGITLNSNLKRLIVLEEAHNFVPERSMGEVTAGKSNPAFRAFTKIASEGRKFNLGLISITQRPANISKYILAQSNTSVVFRLVNKADLDAIQESIESASKEIIKSLPSLTRGQAFICGIGAPLPAIIEVK